MIENKTLYDKEAVTALSNIHLKKNMTWFAVSAILLVYLTFDAYRTKYDNYLTFVVIFAVLGAALVAALIFTFVMSKKRSGEDYGVVRTRLIYRFDETDFKMKIEREGRSHEKSYPYRSLRKVMEQSVYVFIFTSTTSAVILNKDGFSQPEDWQTLKERMQSHGVKFR